MKFLWTALYVKNLDESIDFYSDLVGLQVVRRFPAGPGVEIALMGNGVENETLVELLADSSRNGADFTESISVGFAVDSLDAMLSTVKERNIPVQGGPIETPSSRFFTIKDPNGLNVQFFQKR
jgi:lactoylglutathione lyase